ncbi:radical SAM protein [Candidatus Sumerlaeota bacterium]|nr:radical SAM protein [Candidatus Sumerlaeota bacterium]
MRNTTIIKETPEYLRTSLAAAMVLGFKPGRFYRNARMPCINLLMTYESGCVASCAYCGLSRKRNYTRHQSFIRVEWPTYSLDQIIEAIAERNNRIKRICISMITHRRAVADTHAVVNRIRERLDTPISLLISPTLLTREDLVDFKALGADRIGVAIDAATPELFDKLRGRGIGGPHRWDKYWEIFVDSVEVFGKEKVGAHFIVGLGETEQEMCRAIEKARILGGVTHLFSFYPEPGSAMENVAPPPIGTYRRIQLFRYLRDLDICSVEQVTFNAEGKIISFGVEPEQLDEYINSGKPFMTSGCPDNETGEVACTRPFGNSPPGEQVRNLPYTPNAEDITRIKTELWS